jgi:prepilin-type processing-associated H-X9-DG protein
MIGLALHEYHDIHGCFPAPFSVDANGKPLHSWRVAMLPFMASTTFDSTFDYTVAWNHPKNVKVSARWSHLFQCPSARQPAGTAFTNYVMVLGQKRTAQSGQVDHPPAIIVVEIVNSDIHWTEPRDLNFDEMSFTINDKTKPSISSHHVHRAMVLYADGHVEWLHESTDPDELKKLLTENLEDASGRGKR